MKSARYLILELFLLFFVLPVSLAIPFNIFVKVGLVLVGFAYVVWVLLRVEKVKFRVKRGIPWKSFWKRTLLIFAGLALLTSLYVYWKTPEQLFFIPRQKPYLFVVIFFVYTFLSVWQQELIYRTFFFKRYQGIIKGKALFIFVNAIVFSLCHIFFRNALVMLLTFLGGLLFGLTYWKHRSTTLVTIEHALYGFWLYGVGMGEMLGFPGMEE